MGRTLEFAMATAMIYIINITLAFLIANEAGNYIFELFNIVNEALSKALP